MQNPYPGLLRGGAASMVPHQLLGVSVWVHMLSSHHPQHPHHSLALAHHHPSVFKAISSSLPLSGSSSFFCSPSGTAHRESLSSLCTSHPRVGLPISAKKLIEIRTSSIFHCFKEVVYLISIIVIHVPYVLPS